MILVYDTEETFENYQVYKHYIGPDKGTIITIKKIWSKDVPKDLESIGELFIYNKINTLGIPET